MSRIHRIRPFARGLLTGALVAAALSVSSHSSRIAATLGLPITVVLAVLILFGGASLYGAFVYEPRTKGDAGIAVRRAKRAAASVEDESTVAMVNAEVSASGRNPAHATSEELAQVSGGAFAGGHDAACSSTVRTPAQLAMASPARESLAVVLLGVAVLLITVSIPFLIIYWLGNPLSMKRMLKTGVFLASLCYSASYFLAHRDRFPTPADKIGYFSGVVLGPVSVIEAIS